MFTLDNRMRTSPLEGSTPFLQMITNTTIWNKDTATQGESCIPKIKVPRWNTEIIDACIRVEEGIIDRALPSSQQIQELHRE
jgi:hypothetical protein